jgi:CheY-like chemotaxis protein
MPGMEGWQLARRIREICREKGIPKTPFILLTARHRQVRGEEKMIEHGVEVVLDKPIEFGGLLEVVRRLLRKGRYDENR